jgi:RNA polymerase sigma-70 factor (ECF subfamily)
MDDTAPDGQEGTPRVPFLSDQSTVELIELARAGNGGALLALLERCLPPLRRWAHGRLPPAARGALDTADLVQEAALHALTKLDTFEPRHVGALQAYLRTSVVNLIRDQVRRTARRPTTELGDDHHSDFASPLEEAIRAEEYVHYRDALSRLSERDRAMIVARIEMQWSLGEIADRFGMRTDAVRMAITRAVRRLSKELDASRGRVPR